MLCCFLSIMAAAQKDPILIDEVSAVIGKNAIFKSEIMSSAEQLKMQGAPNDLSTECYVLQERLFEKLLVHKAEVDSIEVSDSEIDDAIDRRMSYMLMRLEALKLNFKNFTGRACCNLRKKSGGQ